MKRICFIGGYSNGGTETAAFFTANMLSETYKIFMLNISQCTPVCNLNGNIVLDSIKCGDSLTKRIIEIYRYIKINKIDIVINVEADIGLFTIPISIFYKKCKYVIWEHANLFQIHNKFIPYIRRYTINHFNKYILLTKRDEKNFINKYGNNDKFEVIYNSVRLPHATEYSLNSKTIISAGHHNPTKNFKIIPDIGRTIFSRHPDWKWEIYGERCGNTYEELEHKIKSYRLEKNIILKKRSNDMPKVYKKGAIYVLTSLTEGLPMVLLEAKSYKLPIVSFDIETGPDEIIQDGVNGFLVKPYDVNSMAEKICELIENFELRQKMSDNSYINIDKFSEEKITNKWKNVLGVLEEE